MISCAEAVRQLWKYLDEELSPDDHAEVDGHLALCRRCCGELDFAGELQSFLRSKRGTDLPVDVQARLERFVDTFEREERP